MKRVRTAVIFTAAVSAIVLTGGNASALAATESAAIAKDATGKGKYFAPTKDTVVKRTLPLAKNSDAGEIQALASGKGTGYKVKAGSPGELCGAEPIDKVSGHGKTTLVMSVEESVETEVTTEVKVEAKVVSAGVGFNVRKSRTVKKESRYEVPKGKFGMVQAHVYYDNYPIKIYKNGKKIGNGQVLRPSGVCLNESAT